MPLRRLKRRLGAGSSEDEACSGRSFEVDMSVVSQTQNLRSQHLRSSYNSSSISSDVEANAGGQTVSERTMASTVSSSISDMLPNRTLLFAIILATIGFFVSTLFLGFGISAAVSEQQKLFQIRATEVSLDFQAAWEDYETSSRWLHQACGMHPNGITQDDFLSIYQYATTNLEVKVRCLRLLFISFKEPLERLWCADKCLHR
jgi:hypothetical protein